MAYADLAWDPESKLLQANQDGGPVLPFKVSKSARRLSIKDAVVFRGFGPFTREVEDNKKFVPCNGWDPDSNGGCV
jgi:hypothetical protein